MKKEIKIGMLILALIGVGLGGFFVYKNYRGVGPAINPPAKNIASIFANRNHNVVNGDTNARVPSPAVNDTDFPITLPDGFKIDLVASGLPDARVIQFDPTGNLWVSQTKSGVIAKISLDANGAETSRKQVFTGLNRPSGFVFDPDNADIMYIGEENKVIKTTISHPTDRTTLMTLPAGAGHFTRSLGIGPDQKLYTTIGSSCNVCTESSDKRASMWVMDRDGKNQRRFAHGLRNTVFFTWHKGELWGNDMGRDLLGDNLPPDEVNVLKDGKDYGWPNCYGQKVLDTKFSSSQSAKDRCAASEPSRINLQAHSAPLGLAFIDNTAWPADWKGDLLIAYHGSWNRSTPTGYKIVRQKLSADNQPEGEVDFVTGWLSGNSALGRPVDLKFHSSTLYVSDDKSGVIYSIQPL